jgi:hypothetical protein
MAIDPNISLGVKQIELANPLAQYGQIAAIQNAQNQNQLAQFQLGAAQRADLAATAQNELYAKHFDPTKGGINVNAFVAEAAQRGQGGIIPGFLKTEAERVAAATALKKTEGEIAKNEFDLQQKKYNKAWQSAGAAATPQIAIEQITKSVRNGEIDMATATREIQTLQKMPPEEYRNWRANKILELMDAKDQYAATVPKIMSQFESARLPILQQQANIAQGQLGVAQNQFNLAQEKFAFEKANPTLSIQEDPSGLLAVNLKTGVATPVVYGPMGFQAAPAAAPAASMMRQPPAALPGQRTQAIPGMTSVLDQNAAPAAMPMPAEVGSRMPGMPVGGKKEAPAKFNDTDMQLAGLAGSLKEFKDEVGKNLFTGAKFVPSGQDTARMTAKYTALLMGVKDLYTLGALTGPDMSIIESQLTNPASWSGKFTSKKGFDEQIKVIEDMLKRTTTNLESTYGRVPKASKKALEGLPGGAAGGIPGATTNDPLGLGIR